jgi:hypothetical protein
MSHAARVRQPIPWDLACQRNVYCGTVQEVIKSVYDRAIREHDGGVIPLTSSQRALVTAYLAGTDLTGASHVRTIVGLAQALGCDRRTV